MTTELKLTPIFKLSDGQQVILSSSFNEIQLTETHDSVPVDHLKVYNKYHALKIIRLSFIGVYEASISTLSTLSSDLISSFV